MKEGLKDATTIETEKEYPLKEKTKDEQNTKTKTRVSKLKVEKKGSRGWPVMRIRRARRLTISSGF